MKGRKDMKRKQKVLLAVLLVFAGIIGLQLFFQQERQPEGPGTEKMDVPVSHSRPINVYQTETTVGKGATEPLETQAQGSKYNQDESRQMTVDISYLSNFLGEGKQFILKRQIQQLVGGEAKTAACLSYTRSDPEGMRLEFFLLLDTEEILKGSYGFQNGKTQVERSDLTEADVWALKEEEEAKIKREQEAAEESERQRKAEEARKAEKRARKAKEKDAKRQQETDLLTETAEETGELEVEE